MFCAFKAKLFSLHCNSAFCNEDIHNGDVLPRIVAFHAFKSLPLGCSYVNFAYFSIFRTAKMLKLASRIVICSQLEMDFSFLPINIQSLCGSFHFIFLKLQKLFFQFIPICLLLRKCELCTSDIYLDMNAQKKSESDQIILVCSYIRYPHRR